MSGLQWWQGLGGVASVLAGAKQEKEKFDNNPTTNNLIDNITAISVVLIIVIILNILLVVLAYKMFPDYKGLHALLTFILGFFWLIPAILYYLFALKGYHMKGLSITRRH